MNRSLALLLVIGAGGLSAGCAPPPPPPKTAAPAAASTKREPAEPRWRTAVLSSEGISVIMPDESVELEKVFKTEKGPMTFHGLHAIWGAPEKTEYDAVYVDLPPSIARGETEVMFRMASASLEKIEDQRRLTMGDFEGMSYEGLSKGGFHTMIRAYAVGGGFYMTSVASKRELDRPKALRFLDSFQFTIPWRVYASTEGRFTISVPSITAEITPPLSGAPAGVQMRFFYLGGRAARGYGVLFGPVDPTRQGMRSDEEMLEEGMMAMGSAAGAWVEKPKPVQFGDLTGLEATKRDGEGTLFRIRSGLSAGRFYMAVITSKDASQINDADADRFLDSWTRGAPR